MKWRVGKKYLRVGLLALVLIMFAIFFQYSLEHETRFAEIRAVISGTLWPILVGVILAYLLNPILNFFEQYIFMPVLGKFIKHEERKKKMTRFLGIFCTFILFLILVVGGLYLVIPQVYLSLVSIVKEAPEYYNKVENWINSLEPEQSELRKYLIIGLERIYSQALQYLNDSILPNMDKIVASITSGIVGGLKAILNVVLAAIISIYVMAGKETLISVAKKLVFSIFSKKNANSIIRGVRYADNVFGGFINGKIIDSFIIGALCYLFMVIAGFDYAVLVSIVVGVTNIIPYFGPFIGAIPSILILTMTSLKEGFIFAIFVVILQQLDGNVIGPLILGDRLKISSMWILFAILIGGGFFGVPGMILGAPCFACIYAFVGTICKKQLKQKHLPVETSAYYGISEVEEEEIENGIEIESDEENDIKIKKNLPEEKVNSTKEAHKNKKQKK